MDGNVCYDNERYGNRIHGFRMLVPQGTTNHAGNAVMMKYV